MKNRLSIRGIGKAWIPVAIVAGIALFVAVIVDGLYETESGPARQKPASEDSAGTMVTSPTDALEYPPVPSTTVAQEVQAMVTDRTDSNSPTKPEQAMATTEAPDSSPPPLQAGIVDGVQQGPFSSGAFEVGNFWQGPAENGWMLVYAGATRSVADGTLGPGALRVYSVTTDASDMATSVPGGRQVALVGIFTASTSGPLNVVAVNGGVLDLRSDDGETLTFNLQTLKFS